MSKGEFIRKYSIHMVAFLVAVILGLYGSNLLVHSAFIRMGFASADSIFPWGLIQFSLALSFWYLTLQAGARSRVFCICVLLPLLLEFVFHRYFVYAYKSVNYSTVVESAFCTTMEQMSTYADFMIFAMWAVVLAIFLVYVTVVYKRLWKVASPHAGWWFAGWAGLVLISYLAISCHGTSIPNARYYLAQISVKDASMRVWLGDACLVSGDLADNPAFRELTERRKYSNIYLPYARVLIWGNALYNAVFPKKLQDAAGYVSEMKPVEGKLCVVLYIGESFRYDHTPFSGYQRNTLPLVSCNYSENLIVLPNVESYDTYTISCMYGILTDATNAQREASISSFMGIFKKHGFHCTVVDGTADGAPWSNAPQLRPVLAGSYHELLQCDDETGLRTLVLEKLASHDANMIIIEDGTGHQPYSEATGKIWGSDVVARYDEARLVSDKKLYALISELKDQPAILFYVSDHAESLGDGGRWYHGGPLSAKEQRHVAAFIWYSDAYAKLYPEVVRNLQANAAFMTEQGCIFHTMPTMGGIHSEAQDPAMDIASPHPARQD